MHELRPIKTHLFTPGPTSVPDAVRAAMAAPVIHHRTPAFQAVLQEVLDRLPELFGTGSDVAMFTASGTGAMESAIANLAGPGDTVLVAEFGRFGQRWAEIAEAYGITVHVHATEWGQRPDADAIAAFAAAHPEALALYTTHSETSTGVVSDAGAIAAAVRAVRPDLLLVLDAISSLGAVECRMDEWGYDAVVAGSQKALMLPPGLAFVGVGPRAEARCVESGSPLFYLSWQTALASGRKSPASTPFTPALTIVLGAKVALDMLFEEGLQNVYERHVRLGRATRAAVAALGLELFGPDHDSSSVLTAIRMPDGDAGARIPQQLREYGVTIAGAQAHLKGKVFRIGHTGWVNDLDQVLAIAALERAMVELGIEIEPGAGVAAAQRVLLGAGAGVGA